MLDSSALALDAVAVSLETSVIAPALEAYELAPALDAVALDVDASAIAPALDSSRPVWGQ